MIPTLPEPAITGGCLCGRVRYQVTGRFLRANHCHCSYCRRHSGAAGLTQGRVRREDFQLLSGEASLRVYSPAEGAAVKVFCTNCGSSLFGGTWPEGPQVTIRLGSVVVTGTLVSRAQVVPPSVERHKALPGPP